MAAFNFRLQKFLGLKEKLEEQKRIEFGNAARALEEEKRTLEGLKDERAAAIIGLRRVVASGTDPFTWRNWNEYIENVKRWIKIQEGAVKRAEEFLEIKRGELVEAMRERKTIEVLRDKRKEEFIIDEKRAEQKLLDELVSSRSKRVISDL